MSDDQSIGDEAPAEMILALSKPLMSKQGTIAELKLSEPRARHVLAAEEQLDTEMSPAAWDNYRARLVAEVSGVPVKLIDRIVIKDSNIAVTYLQAFIDAGGDDEDDADQQDEGDEEEYGDLPERVTIALDPPVEFVGKSYSSIDLRSPDLGESRAAKVHLSGPKNMLFKVRKQQMHLVQAVSGLPMPVIEGLRIRDLNRASRVLGRFIVAGQTTSKASRAN